MARFEDRQHVFWDVTRDVGVQPTLSDRALRDAERLLGVTLPASLVELLRLRNGGLVAAGCDAFPTTRPTSWAPDHIPFDFVTGIGRSDVALSMLDSPYLVGEWGLPANVVLLFGEGHYWIALDYRSCGPHGEPSVTWLDPDTGELPLAPDFRSFVEGLVSVEDFATE